MTVVSIDLVLMQELADELDRVVQAGPDAAARINRKLDDVWLSAPGLSRWLAGGETIWRLSCLAGECRDRLAMARVVAGSTPGDSLRSVSFDDTVFLNQDAAEAVGLIEGYIEANQFGQGGPVPQALLDLLHDFGGDPGFAAGLAARLPADDLAEFLVLLNSCRVSLADGGPDGTGSGLGLPGFDLVCNQVLDGLAGSLGLAARNMTDDQLAVFTGGFQQVLTDGRSTLAPGLLSLLIGRGSWPDGFLTGVAATILDAGGSQGAAGWGAAGGAAVVDPRFNPDIGGYPLIVDPLAGVFQSAATFSPGWMLQFFQGNGVTDLDLPGYDYADGASVAARTVEVDSRLGRLFQDYGFDDSSAYWFGLAAGNATSWDLQYGDQSGRFAADVAWEAEDQARQQVMYDHSSWWDRNGHELLTQLGSVLTVASILLGPEAPPVVGWLVGITAALVDGVNAGMYFGQGDYRDGLLIAGSLIVPVVVGGVVRWVRVSRSDYEEIRRAGQGEVDGVPVTESNLDAAIPPGRRPPSRPAEDDSDGGVGVWKPIGRGKDGAAYQAQISGVPRADGEKTMEYLTPFTEADGSTGEIMVDGHVWRGQPPEEIFLEAKDGYNFPIIRRPWGNAAKDQLDDFTDEAIRQVEAARQAGGRVEWHFSDEDVANWMRDYFQRKEIDVTVIYTPKI